MEILKYHAPFWLFPKPQKINLSYKTNFEKIPLVLRYSGFSQLYFVIFLMIITIELTSQSDLSGQEKLGARTYHATAMHQKQL